MEKDVKLLLEDYISVGERLSKKWDFLLEGIEDEHRKRVTAMLLENTCNKIFEETGINVLTEAFEKTDVVGINRILLPIIRRVYPHLTANEFVTIQPMLTPVAQIFYLRYRYGANANSLTKQASVPSKGISKANDEFLRVPGYGQFGLNPYYSSQIVENDAVVSDGREVIITGNLANDLEVEKVLNWKPVIPGTVKVKLVEFEEVDRPVYSSVGGKTVKSITKEKIYSTVKYSVSLDAEGNVNGDTDYLSVSFKENTDDTLVIVVKKANYGTTRYALVVDWEFDLENNNLIPELRISLDTETVTAVTRKLKVEFTQEAAQDLKAYANIDAEAELVGLISSMITAEIDREIVSDLLKGAAISKTHDWATGAGNSVNFLDRNQALAQAVLNVAAEIYRLGKLGRGNWCVCAPTIASKLATTRGFESANEGKFEEFDLGIVYAGTLAGKSIKVYVDPYFPTNKILVGYKGNSILATSYVYAPYQPLYTTPTIYDPNTLVPTIGFISRYGKKLVVGGEYLLGTLTVTNID